LGHHLRGKSNLEKGELTNHFQPGRKAAVE